MNDVEGKDEDQFSYEQVVGNPDSISDQDRKGEPTLITTLAPYNYEIDLPFKQASTKHTCKAGRKKLNQEPDLHEVQVDSSAKRRYEEDYATFSI